VNGRRERGKLRERLDGKGVFSVQKKILEGKKQLFTLAL
jgi:hypothetical protein